MWVLELSPQGKLSMFFLNDTQDDSAKVLTELGLLSVNQVQVGTLARTKLLTCSPNTPLAEAAALMRERACSSILIEEKGQLIGIWTERDAASVDFSSQTDFNQPIRSVMSAPLKSVEADVSAVEAIGLMESQRIRHLLVMNADGTQKGIVTQTDLALHFGLEHFMRLRTVEELLDTTVPQLPGDLGLNEAARRMQAAHCDAAIVRHPRLPQFGIITERDLLSVLAERRNAPLLFECASFPLLTLDAKRPLLEARRFFIDHHIRHLGVCDETGQVLGLISLQTLLGMLQQAYAQELLDVLRKREEALTHSRQALELAHQVIDSSENALMVLDPIGHIETVNPAFERLTGFTAEDAVGKKPDVLLGCDHTSSDFCERLLSKVANEGHWRGELWGKNRNGEACGFEMNLHALLHKGKPTGRYAGVFFDATEKIRAQTLLREERDLIAAGPSVVFKWKHEEGWPVSYVSPNVFSVFGYRPEALLANNPPYAFLIHPSDIERVAGEVKHHLATGTLQYVQHYRLRHANGEWRWVDDFTMVKRNAQGGVETLSGYLIDITEKHRATQALTLSEKRYRDLLHSMPVGIVVMDTAFRIRYTNRAFDTLIGKPQIPLLGRFCFEALGHTHEFCTRCPGKQATHDGLPHVGESRWQRQDGSEIHVRTHAIPQMDAEGKVTGFVEIVMDVTDERTQQEKLEKVAYYDALTGLPNRSLLTQRLDQALRNSQHTGQALAVCVMDLDGFKQVNDTLGHHAGDALLKEIAQRLQLTIRSDDTAARLGGDEFVLLLGGAGLEPHFEDILRRILDAISRPVSIGAHTAQVSGSIGATLFPGDSSEADQLLRHADQAMYKAKTSGKNRYQIFNPAAESRINANARLISRLEASLHKGEFSLAYQPKVDCRAGQVLGLEALLRWNHPVLGIRLPGEFLPLIDQEDTFTRIGDWVIKEVLAQLAAWSSIGIDLPVSINVSIHQLKNRYLEHHLAKVLDGVPSHLIRRLMIELVETAALTDVATVRDLIRRFHPLGLRFSLDDFGTGYSTLAHLKQLPVDELKIDHSFIRTMLDNTGDCAIVQGVIGLARAFNRTMVAEGVEQIEQIPLLLRYGCDVMQGFAIAHPMPAQDIPAWLAAFTPDPRWQPEPPPI
jgi:diguanylate cyclase (GGDEF)-like protein/PAS domain S-box-containing protein